MTQHSERNDKNNVVYSQILQLKESKSRSIDISRRESNARGDVPRGPDFRL